jgi:hypothetical protein
MRGWFRLLGGLTSVVVVLATLVAAVGVASAASPLKGRAYKGAVGAVVKAGRGSNSGWTGAAIEFSVSAKGKDVLDFSIAHSQLPCSQAASYFPADAAKAPIKRGTFRIDTVSSSHYGAVITGKFAAHGRVSGTLTVEGHNPLPGSRICKWKYKWSATAEPKGVSFCPDLGIPQSGPYETNIVATAVSCKRVDKALRAGTYRQTTTGTLPFTTKGWTCKQTAAGVAGEPQYACSRKHPKAHFTFTQAGSPCPGKQCKAQAAEARRAGV